MGVLASRNLTMRTSTAALRFTLLALFSYHAHAYLNVKGGALQKCSGQGMALTGFTRTGHCVDQNDDEGSHHICIDMASNKGGNFCAVTGQPNWCVCQWAFASHLQRAGGCDKIQNIVCDATNKV